jgi:iron complex outermembrane receptor protein
VFGIKRNLSNPIASAYIELDRWAWGARAAGTVPFTLGRTSATLNAGLDAQWLRDDRLNMNVARTAVTRDQLELVNEIGPFVQVILSPVPRLTATIGARYDRVRFEARDRLLTDGDDSGTRLMDAPSASAGLTLRVHDGFTPYASVSTSFETPTTTELGNQPTGPGGFNPTLNPQTAVNLELGARGVIAGRVRYSAALYRADVRDELIPFDVPGAPGRRFFRNAGSSRHQGLELGATVAPVAAVRVRAAYTYSDHRFLSYQTGTGVLDGNRLPGVPQHYLSAAATVEFARRGWVTVEQGVASWLFADDLNTARNAQWSVTNVRMGVDLSRAGWGLSAFGGVGNLWDRRYAGSVQVNAAGGRYYEPAPPRNLFVGMELSGRK